MSVSAAASSSACGASENGDWSAAKRRISWGSPARPNVLISSTKPIPADVQRKLRELEGVKAAMPMSMASLSLEGRTLTIASVDVDAYRRWTPQTTATVPAVWERLAGGEVMVDPSVGRRLEKPRGFLRLGYACCRQHGRQRHPPYQHLNSSKH